MQFGFYGYHYSPQTSGLMGHKENLSAIPFSVEETTLVTGFLANILFTFVAFPCYSIHMMISVMLIQIINCLISIISILQSFQYSSPRMLVLSLCCSFESFPLQYVSSISIAFSIVRKETFYRTTIYICCFTSCIFPVMLDKLILPIYVQPTMFKKRN